MPSFPSGAHLKGGQASAESNAKLAREFYAPIIPVVVDLRRQGLSLRGISRELDRRGIKTRFEYPDQRWNASQVRRVLARAAEDAEAAQSPATETEPKENVDG